MAVDHDKELDVEDLEIEDLGSGQPRGGVLSKDDLEQYGVWVKVKPRPVSQQFDAQLTESRLESLQQELPPVDEGLTEEEEQLLGSLEESSSAESVPELEDLGELSAAEEAGLADLEPGGEQVEVHLSEETSPGGRFDDLPPLGEELGAAGSAPAPRGQVLQKIEEELAAIRGELAALKSELVHLRRPGAGAEVKPSEAEREAGFFSEDSDETIALTGDELDNILNTAEITEEEASEQAVGEDLSEMAAAAPQAKTEEALESVEELTLEEPAQEAAVEPAMEAESIELGLPDVEEIGLDALEVPAEAPVEQPSEEPLEELQVELGEGESAAPAAAAAAAEPVEELLEPEPAAGGEEELALEVPDEVSGDLEPLEALELEEEAGDQAAAKPLEEVSLDVPELELPGEKTADEEIEELSLEVPADKAGEPEALEEIAPAEEPVEEVEELSAEEPAAAAPGPPPQPLAAPAKTTGTGAIPGGLRDEIKTVLKYMDQLLESLPDDKIEEFANSEYFEVYRRLFEELEIA